MKPKRKHKIFLAKSWINSGDKIIVFLASCAAIVILYMLFIRQDDGSGLRDSEPLGVLQTPGTIRRRHARSLNWTNVAGQTPLYLHDIVYVPKDTYAEVIFGENKRLRLEPDSMVQFDEVTVDSIFITLFDGKVQGEAAVVRKSSTAPPPVAAVPKYIPKTIVPLPTMPAELELLGLKHESLMRRTGESRSRVAAMRPEIMKGLNRKELPQDNIAEFDVQLLFPKNTTYNLKANRWLKMEWSEVPLDNVNYTLEMSRDPKFHQSLTHKTTKRSLSVQVDIPGLYFWRVRAERNKVQIASPTGQFTMAKIGGLGNMRETRAIASGRPAGNVAEIASDQKFQNIVSSSVVPGNRCTSTNLSAGVYFCRIRSMSMPKVLATYRFEVK